jgi:3-hydroxybutyryl-CoA dehydrogenase
MSPEVKLLGVVGAGQMGSGIAQLAAVMARDMHVLLTDLDQVSLSKGLHAIASSLSRAVKKGSVSQVKP